MTSAATAERFSITMKIKYRTDLLTALLLSIVAAGSAAGGQLFSANFHDKLDAKWKFVGGTWAARDGYLDQTDSGPADPKKAILMIDGNQDSSMDLVITTKLRFNRAAHDTESRVGISVCSNPESGRGLSLVLSEDRLLFLEDYVAWGESCGFSCDSGKWYWLKLRKSAGEIKGKAWEDGQNEPANWMVVREMEDAERPGFLGLNGGTYGSSAVSFAQITVENEKSGPPLPGYSTLSLNGDWTITALPLDATYRLFTQTNAERLPAKVPGEVHLDLMRAGRMEDPDISDNARTRCRWPEEHSWWYRTEFVLPPGFRQNLRQKLIFDGIDLYGQIFVNGQLAGASKDAFATVDFDVKKLLREGTNELVVRVTCGTELVPIQGRGNGFRDLYSVRSFDQRRLLRKPAYVYGWDWCDPLPSIGLWRGVRLEGRTKVVIDYLRLDTTFRGNEVSLDGEVTLNNLHPWSEIQSVLELQVDPPQGKPIVQRFDIGTQVGRSRVPCHIVIPNAQLWWPNGMGEQPLYKLTARVLCGAQETDRQTQTIGLRTLVVDRSALPDGSRFCFKVNGKEVFCKGGNWAPADLIPARMTPARYQKLVAEARNAHFTMFRVNGVGLYESQDFYDACDRAGILVWQDCAFSCFQYPDQDPEFCKLVRDELEGVVKSLRAHPSLALWSANNECTWGMADWWSCDATRPEDIGGVRIYHEIIPDIVHFYDPARPYWPGSPAGGKDPNSETSGDCHWWDKFGNSGDVNQRIRQEVVDECRSRFVDEYGIIGPPNMASVRQYLKPDELSLTNTAWKIHQNSMERGTTWAGIRYHYGDYKDLSLDQFVLYGQMFQAMLQGGAVEAMRFRKDDPKADCEGALVWSYNDCWGETGWSIIDHYARRKASYYWFRRGAAPVKVLVRSRDGQLVTRVVNDTLKSYKAVVRCGWVRLDGTSSKLQEHSVTVPIDGMVEVATAPIPSPGERDPKEWLYAATLRGEGIPDDQAIWLLAPHCKLAMAKPVITTKIRNGVLEVSSPVYCHGVHLEDNGQEVLADNYIELLPGIPCHIPITKPTPTGEYPLEAVMPIAFQ
jgi:beta-mannosidase